jgi:hypothetical protein
MPTLTNPRWELFAQNRANGLPAYKAYMEAGFKCSEDVAFTNASRLLRNAQVLSRVRELVDGMAENLVVTRESMAAEYDQVIAGAHREKQYGAAASALASKQKLLGLDPANKNLNVNINSNFNQHTDDELQFELASMFNEVRAAAGKQPVALPGPPKEKQN